MILEMSPTFLWKFSSLFNFESSKLDALQYVVCCCKGEKKRRFLMKDLSMCKILFSCNVKSCLPVLYKSFSLNHSHIWAVFVFSQNCLNSSFRNQMSLLHTPAEGGSTHLHCEAVYRTSVFLALEISLKHKQEWVQGLRIFPNSTFSAFAE